MEMGTLRGYSGIRGGSRQKSSITSSSLLWIFASIQVSSVHHFLLCDHKTSGIPTIVETGEHCPYHDSSLSGNAEVQDNQREIEVAAFISRLHSSVGGDVFPITLNVFVLGKSPQWYIFKEWWQLTVTLFEDGQKMVKSTYRTLP